MMIVHCSQTTALILWMVYLSEHEVDACAANPAALNDLQRALGGNLDVERFRSAANGDLIREARDLNCDFEQLGSYCRWQNVNYDELGDWDVATGRPDIGRLAAITRTAVAPNDPFLTAGTNTRQPNRDPGFQLVSDPIPCQRGDGQLSLRHWTSPNVEVRACTRVAGRQDYSGCQSVGGSNPGPSVLTIPQPRDQPFEIVLESRDFTFTDGGANQGGLALVDDIRYDAVLCEGDFPITDRPFGSDDQACDVYNCNMERNSGCLQDVLNGRSSWKVHRGSIGNMNTGIRSSAFGDRTDPYLVLEGPQPGEATFDLPAVRLAQSRLLSFTYYLASFGSKLKVCTENQNGQCLFESPTTNRNSRQWREQTIRLPAGTNQVRFVGEDLRRNNFIGLDNLKLLDENTNDIC